MMIGTTLDVLPATMYENQKIGDGKPGTIAQKLRAMLKEDMKKGPKSTPV
jgi:branched-chain amino acid aminotransferase